MMRSLYSGVSGLKNHQVRMDVIGNNISNVNTNGFKYERVTFQDMISQSIQGASEPKDNIGGVNPKQIGLGMMSASIDKIMSQGALQTTDKYTDLAIQGEGFFILGNGEKQFFTRAGNFDVDKDGNLVNPANGMKVQGWNSTTNEDGEKVLNTTKGIEDIFIPLYNKEPAKMTSEVKFKSNLNSSVLAVPQDAIESNIQKYISDPNPLKRRGHVTSIAIYDDQGNQQNLQVKMWKIANNRWKAKVEIQGATQISVDVPGANQNTTVPANTNFEIGFSPDGRLTYVSDGTDTNNQGKLSVDVSFRFPGNPSVRNISLNLGDSGTVNGVTQFSSSFTTKALEQDGYPMGYMESFRIDKSGIITGTYSNGIKQDLGQIALANFSNPEGLDKVGQNNFVVSNNSGEAIIGESGIAGLGTMSSGFLEMSNVQLADQFTDMIVTQRGFQANSRSITTSDQMLQELLTLKR